MTTPPGKASSYWMDSSEATAYPPLSEHTEVDVAVVGAGIAGLSTAFELTKTGKSVLVCDAGRIAASVTGHTTAKVSSLHTLIYAQLRKSFGADGARLYALSQQDALAHLVRTVDELRIDCELERVPAYTYVESANHTG